LSKNDDFAGKIERWTKHNRRGRKRPATTISSSVSKNSESLQFQISTLQIGRRLCLSGPARSSYRRVSAPLAHPDNHGDLNQSGGHLEVGWEVSGTGGKRVQTFFK
jgi:hypothetical protein